MRSIPVMASHATRVTLCRNTWRRSGASASRRSIAALSHRSERCWGYRRCRPGPTKARSNDISRAAPLDAGARLPSFWAEGLKAGRGSTWELVGYCGPTCDFRVARAMAQRHPLGLLTGPEKQEFNRIIWRAKLAQLEYRRRQRTKRHEWD